MHEKHEQYNVKKQTNKGGQSLTWSQVVYINMIMIIINKRSHSRWMVLNRVDRECFGNEQRDGDTEYMC